MYQERSRGFYNGLIVLTKRNIVIWDNTIKTKLTQKLKKLYVIYIYIYMYRKTCQALYSVSFLFRMYTCTTCLVWCHMNLGISFKNIITTRMMVEEDIFVYKHTYLINIQVSVAGFFFFLSFPLIKQQFLCLFL